MLTAEWSILLQVFVHQGLQLIVAGYVGEEEMGQGGIFGILVSWSRMVGVGVD
jgi:hypothetical protein